MHLFVRLVELKSFSAAAREMRVKQTTASKWLQALEQELGVVLMERTTRTMRLTESGETFYQRAKDVLAAYENTTAELQQRAPSLSGRLRVSVPVVFGRLFVLPEATKFMRRFSEVQLELVFSDRYINLVEEGFDATVRVGLPVDSSIKSRVVGTTPRRLVASPSYVKARGLPTTPDDLRNHDCLLHSEISVGTVWNFRREKRNVRSRVGGRIAANNSEALLHMAREGLGVALLAAWLVDDDLRAKRLVPLLPDYEPPGASIQVLMSPSGHTHPRVRAFVDFLSGALAPKFGGVV
jgi:DNA-binding transcriptional LysR family regulator